MVFTADFHVLFYLVFLSFTVLFCQSLVLQMSFFLVKQEIDIFNTVLRHHIISFPSISFVLPLTFAKRERSNLFDRRRYTVIYQII